MAEHEFRIDSESPANKDLMFWRIVGHEGLSRPSAYELTVLSQDRAIDPRQILGHAFDVVIEFEDAHEQKHERHARGHAVRVVRAGQVGRFFEYRISLRAWFGLLAKRVNSCILQEKAVLKVLEEVLQSSPIKACAKTEPAGVIGVHEPRRYCVQFQESDYNFLSRVLEDEGIYYWFDSHGTPGVMHLADATGMAHGPLPAAGVLNHVGDGGSEARFNEIERWVSARQLRSGKYRSRDVNYKTIKTQLDVHGEVADAHELADLEVFEYTGGYFTGDESKVVLEVRSDELPARQALHWAITRWPDVAVGHTFTFQGDPDGTRDGDYLVAGCIFVATHPGYEGMGAHVAPQPTVALLRESLRDDAVNAGCTDALIELIDTTPALREGVRGTSTFLITSLPANHIFRPPRLTPRVTMPGPQTAIVVGGKGKEHDVDAMGRVKVQFPWDRNDFRDDRSTCWIRVSQPWAGKGWGGYFAPRINQEVIVEFMNGDPDRPVITGRVYNDDQPIPYKSATQSGFKTRSTPGGGPSNYNEIMFEDKKGEEVFSMHAERNMATEVEVDDSTHVGHDQSLSVMNDRFHTIEKNETNEIKVKQVNKIGKRQETHVGGDGQKIEVDGPQESLFSDTQLVQIKKKQTVKALADRLVDVTGFERHNVGMNHDVDITGFQTVSVGKDHALLVTGNTKLQSSGERTDLTVGGHTLVADKFAIAAAGSSIDIYAQGDINLTGMNINQTVLGSVKKGITGSVSSVEMGTSQKTSLSASSENKISAVLSNAIGFSCKNEIAVSIVNQISVGIENTGAAKIKNTLFSEENAAMKLFKGPSAGGGGGAPPSGPGPMAVVAAVVGLAMGGRAGAVGLAAAGLQVVQAARNEVALENERVAQQQRAVAELRRLQDEARKAKTPAMDSLANKLQALENAVSGKPVTSPVLDTVRSAAAIGKAIAANAPPLIAPGFPRP